MSVGWDDDDVVTRWDGLPALDGDTAADACVVGLGGSGLAAVESLMDRGLSVVGVDAGRVAAGAAGRNGGFLLGGPDMYLHSAIDAWGEQAAVWLYRATLRELDHRLVRYQDGVDAALAHATERLIGHLAWHPDVVLEPVPEHESRN